MRYDNAPSGLLNGPEMPPPNLNSANIFLQSVGAKLQNLKTANISFYMVYEDCRSQRSGKTQRRDMCMLPGEVLQGMYKLLGVL